VIFANREPLTRAQLRDVWAQNPTPTTKLLLWEIHRLRTLVLRANDLVRSISTRGAISIGNHVPAPPAFDYRGHVLVIGAVFARKPLA